MSNNNRARRGVQLPALNGPSQVGERMGPRLCTEGEESNKGVPGIKGAKGERGSEKSHPGKSSVRVV